MTGYEYSRWHEECFGRCGDCASCLHLDNINEETNNVLSKRFLTVGSVRYGVRLGAVSPPPPGAGPRYRSQCCWPSNSSPGLVSQIPLLATPAINNRDIFSCVNRMRMAEDAASALPEQAKVRDQVLHCTKSLLKNQLSRRTLAKPQVYARLCECGDGDGADIFNTLDRLPRFRFGGNRNNSAGKDRDRDKRTSELRLRELTDRLKRRPVPPPRSRHVSHRIVNPPPPTPSDDTEDNCARSVPLRSASFSQVDYSSDSKKYVRRRCPTEDSNLLCDDPRERGSITLPRSKNSTNRTVAFKNENRQAPSTDEHSEDVTQLCEMIYQGCREDTIIDALSNSAVEAVVQDSDDNKQTNNDIIVRNSEVDNNRTHTSQEKKRDKSRRRKGIYISQWPNSYQDTDDIIPQLVQDDNFTYNIPKLKVCCETNSDSCTNSDDKLQSPEDTNVEITWPNRVSRPPLSTQTSEEKDSVKSCHKGNLLRSDSLSEGETDHSRCEQQSFATSDVSDCEIRTSTGNSEPILNHHIPRRYSKRPLRGPYGQMLEAEMKKPETGRKNYYTNDLKFLEDITGPSPVSLSCSSSVGSGDPKPKYVTRIRGSSNHSLDDSQLKNCLSSLVTSERQIQPLNKRKISIDSVVNGNNRGEAEPALVISHQRTTSSPSKLEGTNSTEASSKLLEHLLRGSSEQLATAENLQRSNDTRTHVVVELYDTERSYVESLQILILKYLEPLKSPENSGLLDATLVDEIFFQIPSLLSHHQVFLDELKKRLDHWDIKQKVGDVFLETFSKPAVIESYTNYVNNWKRARDIIKSAQQSKPAFAKFLESTAREHKGKLALDSLLIKPIQKFPKYELLLQRLIKHTDISHPDHSLLLSAQREVHEQLLRINCTEREALELEQLREIEALIDGLIELVATDRQYLRHDLVSMAAGGGTRKERALFLFSDLLLVTSMKRKSGTIRKPTAGQGSVTSSLEANKYKLLMKISLDDLDIVKAKDESLKQMMVEIENLTEDVSILNQINELTWTLHCTHSGLDEVIKEMFEKLNRQLVEQQNSDSQLSCLDLTLNTSNGLENMSIVFSKPEKRASWEESFNEAKHKLAMTGDRRPCPELIAAVPIRKTRAGLQFTCAAPTIGENRRDVWVCNSDGYVGQVCVLSLQPEPNVTSCNGVCNARILCIASIPGINNGTPQCNRENNGPEAKEEHTTIQFDSSSSSEDDDRSDGEDATDNNRASTALKTLDTASTDSEEPDNQQSTMWLGTEDGCIHVYNSTDNIRIKKNKVKLQHGSAVLSIIYMENKVFIALANGDIIIYDRDASGNWNTNSPTTVSIGSSTMPVSKMLPSAGKLWCGCGNTVKVLNTETLVTENSVTVNNDANKPITCIMLSGNGLWLSLQTSAIIKCFHTISFELLCEVNIAPAVTKMLTSCDDIIRQHKAACLRVTSLLACKELLWIGTSAGVLLTMSLPHITPTTTKMNIVPSVVGVPYGHTGHVRFLTNVEYPPINLENIHQRYSYKGKPEQRTNSKLLVISGGDGYEDFRSSNISEVAGREDSTNHLLLWNI
ncbi:hypothetical protein RN001_016215 [Aquatica leii]|uniref:DH domain-containing protein n=1 Tax=Aquatica leii TaxID=1421715 RepID=A0AAN7P1F6_9COLE|nr:hypothetical protein RN001_016215 [Aquatica leii]